MTSLQTERAAKRRFRFASAAAVLRQNRDGRRKDVIGTNAGRFGSEYARTQQDFIRVVDSRKRIERLNNSRRVGRKQRREVKRRRRNRAEQLGLQQHARDERHRAVPVLHGR